MADNTGVLVFAELKDGQLLGMAREAIGIGAQLAKSTGGAVSAVAMGKDTSAAAKQLIAAGAATVYTA